jgi:hypothetical protein
MTAPTLSAVRVWPTVTHSRKIGAEAAISETTEQISAGDEDKSLRPADTYRYMH